VRVSTNLHHKPIDDNIDDDMDDPAAAESCPRWQDDLPINMLTRIFSHGVPQTGQLILCSRDILLACCAPAVAGDFLFHSHSDSMYRALHRAICSHAPVLIMDHLVARDPAAAICLLPLACGSACNPIAVDSILRGFKTHCCPVDTSHFPLFLKQHMFQALLVACQRGSVLTAQRIIYWIGCPSSSHDDDDHLEADEEVRLAVDMGLMVAVECSQAHIVGMMIDYGADLGQVNEELQTPLMLALDQSDTVGVRHHNHHHHSSSNRVSEVIITLLRAMWQQGHAVDENWLVIRLIDSHDATSLKVVLQHQQPQQQDPRSNRRGGRLTPPVLVALANSANLEMLRVVCQLAPPTVQDVNCVIDGITDWTPVMYAAKNGNIDCLRSWLDMGGRLSAQQIIHVLHVVISDGHLTMTQFLLDLAHAQGVYEKVLSNMGHFVVVCAAERNDNAMVNMLLRTGLTHAAFDVFIVACQRGNLGLLQQLVEEFKCVQQLASQQQAYRALFAACRYNQPSVLAYLLNHTSIHTNALPSVATECLLRQAIFSGHGSLHMYKQLQTATTQTATTPLTPPLESIGCRVILHAGMGAGEDCIRILEDETLRSSLQVEDLNVALIHCLRTIVKEQQGPPAAEEHRRTHWPKSRSVGQLELIKALLQAGADTQAHDDEAMALACSSRRSDIVALLLEHGAQADARSGHMFNIACQLETVSVMQQLLRHSAPRTYHTNWAAVVAARHGQMHMLQLLVDSGSADPDAFEGLPLYASIRHNALDQVQFLLRSGSIVRRDHVFCAARTAMCCVCHDAAVTGSDISCKSCVAASLALQVLRCLLDSARDTHPEQCRDFLRELLLHAVNDDNLVVAKWLMTQLHAAMPPQPYSCHDHPVCKLLVEAWLGVGVGVNQPRDRLSHVVDFLLGQYISSCNKHCWN